MLKTLDERGTKLVRYGRDEQRRIEQEFDSARLRILGPTKEHLEICRKAIAASMQDAVADAMRLANSDVAISDVETVSGLGGKRAAGRDLLTGAVSVQRSTIRASFSRSAPRRARFSLPETCSSRIRR